MKLKHLFPFLLGLSFINITYAAQPEAKWVENNRIPGYSRCYVASIQMFQIVPAARPDAKKLNDNLVKIRKYLISSGLKNEAMVTAELNMEISNTNKAMSQNADKAGEALMQDFFKCVNSFGKK